MSEVDILPYQHYSVDSAEKNSTVLLTPASFSINHLQRLGCSVPVENRVNAAFSAKCLVCNVHCTVLRVKCAVFSVW